MVVKVKRWTLRIGVALGIMSMGSVLWLVGMGMLAL